MIECITYRMGDHSTSDDASRYRNDAEVREWAKKDPIARLEKYMISKKLLDGAYKAKVEKDAKAKVEEAATKYEAYPPAKKEDFFTYMFADMPEQLREQFAEFKGE